jgi:adenine-specific DNA-methyltransferase
MNEEHLDRLIEEFTSRNLNLFFRSKCENYAETPEDMNQYIDDRFSDFQKLGEIRFDNGDKLVVTTSKVSGDLSERSGKKAQYEKAKKILKELAVYDAGFFIFHDDSDSFRFSLVYGQAEGTRKSWSNFRRFTYFVSKNYTNKTFRIRVGGCAFVSLEAVKDAFSVEKVTKDFYKQIADWYFWAVQNVTFPKDAEAEDNGRNIAVIRLITRLIFIWFMKERKLVSPELFEKSTASGLLKSLEPNQTTYYKAVLQNLFFATLNTKKDERNFRFVGSFQGKNTDYMDHGIYRYEAYFKNREDMLAVFKDIPFLNGGLFDCLDWSAIESGTGREVRFDGFSDKDVGLIVPNYLFFSDEKEADLNEEYGTKNKKYHVQGLFNILSAYNFTIDENDPNDQEVALDPELLGKVFENLLASFNPETATTARKATGSYYTPREIVDYMVTQSLKQYYKTHLSDVKDIDNKLDELLMPVTSEAGNPFNEADSRRVAQLTEGLRIVDPAVGSGAFPMGILNKLVSVLSRVDPENRLWKEAQLYAVKDFPEPAQRHQFIEQINERFSRKSINYLRKLYLIQKCIYGVDIQQIAIEIAKLRFFIALLVDEDINKNNPDNWGIEPLPNLDFKLMQGNSLISEFMGINLDAEDSDAPAKLMKDETDELISEYRNKKTDYQYEPDRKKKEALKADIDGLIIRIFESKLQSQKASYYTRFKAIEAKYASVPDIRQREEAIRKDIEALNRNYGFDLTQAEKKLKEFTTGFKMKPFFAWMLYFAEVFHEKGGFDIVITNPPYLGEKGHKEIFWEIKQGTLKEYYQGKMDLFYFFSHLALNLGVTNAQIAFITTNYYPTASGATKLRKDFKDRAIIRRLINFNELKIFESALGQHNMVSLMSKGHDGNAKVDTCITSRTGMATMKILQDILTWDDAETTYQHLKQNDLYEGDEYYIRIAGSVASEADPIQHILNRIKTQGQELTQFCNINQGIISSADRVTPKHLRNYKIKAQVGDGIFVLDNEEIAALEIPRSDKRILKPWFKNSDVARWYTNVSCTEYLIYADKRTHNLEGNILKNHLLKFKSILDHSTDNSPYLHRPRDIDFCGPKIVVPQRSYQNTFAFNDVPWYASADVYFITEKDEGTSLKYCLALLNSKLYYLWLYHKGKRKGEMLELYQVPLSEIPIKKISKIDQKPFISIVDKILAITEEEDYFDSPDKQARVEEYERQIDQMVYDVYGLTEEEKAMVEEFAKSKRN